jgi:hypothetical protein
MNSPARKFVLALAITLLAVGTGLPAVSQTVFINEIHYDNTGADAGEAVEIAGPAGTSLAGWTIVPYNGTGGVTYTPVGTLSGTIPDLCGGYGVVSVAITGLQNGAPDGLALVNASSIAVQFLSYEGTFTATNGPANGMTSTSIGVLEDGTGAVGLSLQLSGAGTVYTDFTWQPDATNTFGACNTGQTFVVPDTAPSILSTIPTAGATGVATTANLTVTFTEPVTTTGTWFTLECPVPTPIAFSVSGGPTTYTIDPTADLPVGTSCAATVIAANVLDQDGTPTAMASNYAWTFLTASPLPNLTINDVTLAEGNAGTTTFTFTVSLSAPAPTGGVTFDIATADGTATQPSDYTTKSLLAQTIPAGSSTYAFDVLVNGDGPVEANETFFVNVTNVTNAIATDGQGVGTISNDDYTPIHDIQGAGTDSPLVSTIVTTRGIVTGVKFNNGFFIQEPDATIDADPNTSEGVFVFTSSPPTVAIGDLVQVTATVAEYAPGRGSLTELTTPTVVVVSSGNPLPAPIALSATLPDPTGTWNQLERLEGMRVSVASLTVTAPTTGSTNEPNATGSSNGVVHGVVTGVPKPLREAGIQQPDPLPLPTIPRWDSNPELLRVDSDGLVGATQLNLSSGAILAGLVGPLDYAFDRYSVLPDAATPPTVTPGIAATPVATPLGSEFTVASYNLERFFDTEPDPTTSDPVLTAAAYANRLGKASLGIRDYLKTPDVLGIAEVENLTTLQDVATKINADAVTAGQPNPVYVAFLVEGNDVGGIDVGFLVKTSLVFGTTPRIEVLAVTQELDGTLFVNADASTETLNDRPPLMLRAIVHHANGAAYPMTVIVNHLRSMSGVDDTAAGSNGWATVGDRVRAKRLAQAIDLATLVQARQVADPAERIVLVGDFNAFDVNDGYGDSMSTIAGVVFPDNTTTVPGDGTNIIEPDFVNLVTTAPALERYSFMFDGTAQSLDHVLANAPVVTGTLARRLEHPRINADFPENARSLYGPTDATRLSDHDPLVGFFQIAAFLTADLAVTKVDTPDPVTAGMNLAYTITVTNNGPDAAATASFSDTLPAGTTFVSLVSPGGWSCTTPAVGAAGIVSCSDPSLAVGSAAFTLTVAVAPGVVAGTVFSNTAIATSSTADGTPANNSATATTTVSAEADVSITVGDSPDPINAGADLTWTATVSNAGPSYASLVTLTTTLPAGTTFVSATAPGTWSCTAPPVGAGGTVTCDTANLAPAASDNFTLVVATDAALAGGSTITGTATVTSTTTDPNAANNTASATTTVNASSGVSIGVVDAPDPVAPGDALAWTVTLTNLGPSAASTVTWSDLLPPDTTFTSLASAAGWACAEPAAGANGTVSCSIASFPVGTATFIITGTVTAATPIGTVLSNTASITAVTGDTDPGDNTSTSTTNVFSPALLSATKAASGNFAPGGTVTYTIVLHNAAATAQADNPGNELVDVLPTSLTLVSANATSGTAVATVGTNTVTWNGTIAAGGTVTITITATVRSDVGIGTSVSNQATISYDADGNGTNETTVMSDNPATGAAGDPTVFVLAAQAETVIPSLDGVGLAILALLVALGGALLVGRRLS